MSVPESTGRPEHQPDRRRFVLAVGGSEALLEYRLDATAVVFTHTFVPPSLRGGGIAAQLVDFGLAWARDTGLEVRSECSYVSARLARGDGTQGRTAPDLR